MKTDRKSGQRPIAQGGWGARGLNVASRTLTGITLSHKSWSKVYEPNNSDTEQVLLLA